MKYIKDNLLVGSDPELFLWDSYQKKFVSSIDKIGGTKDNPRPLKREGFFVQEDNVLAEFNIPPAKTEDEFVTNIVLGMELVKGELQNPFLELKPLASAFMPEDQLLDPRAQVFGCDPDYNAWLDGKRNSGPTEEAKSSPLRSAGGHLLVGYELADPDLDKEDVDMNIIRHCDLYLGVPSVLMDKDVERKKLYGKAGSYRHKSFGVEYRTLSSFWLGSQRTIGWAYRNMIRAVKQAGDGVFLSKETAIRVQAAINTANVRLARDLVKEHNLDVCMVS